MQRQSLITFHRQTDTQPVFEQKMANLPKPPPLCFISEHDVIWHGVSLWFVRVICPVVSPPNLLCTPQSLHWGGRVRNREGLDSVQSLFSNS